MRITIKAKASIKGEKVEKLTQSTFGIADKKQKEVVYRVWVRGSSEGLRVNGSIIRILAKRFNTVPSQIRLVLGANSKVKVFEIVG